MDPQIVVEKRDMSIFNMYMLLFDARFKKNTWQMHHCIMSINDILLIAPQKAQHLPKKIKWNASFQMIFFQEKPTGKSTSTQLNTKNLG